MEVYLYAILLLLIFGCQENKKSNSTQTLPSQDIDSTLLGEFHVDGFNSGVSLLLQADSSFTYQTSLWGCTGGGMVTKIKGRYTITNQTHLSLAPAHLIYTEYFGFDLEDYKRDSTIYYQSDSTKIKTDYGIIKWADKVYLLSEEPYSVWGYPDENDYINFINYYNNGYEPNTHGSYFVKTRLEETQENVLTTYKKTQQLNSNQLPDAWREMLLNHPIQAMVIAKVSTRSKDPLSHQQVYHYTLNKGKAHGVRIGHRFYGEGCCTLQVLQVDSLSCKGIIEFCPYDQNACHISDTLSTFLSENRR